MKNIYLILFLFVALSACKHKPKPVVVQNDLEQIIKKGELVVLTCSGSTSYYLYRGQEMGYQYELSKQLADDLGVKLRVKVVSDVSKLSEMLLKGEGDLIAYRLPVTNELKQKISFVKEESITSQVLVQSTGDNMVNNVVDLIGKTVYVQAHTKYADRLKNLNEEIGGGIVIKMAPDSLDTEELIDLVSQKKIPFTVVDNDIALLNKTYDQDIDCHLSISFSQRSAWAVRKNSPHLLAKLNDWIAQEKQSESYALLYKKYFERTKYFSDKIIIIPKGKSISRYDELFKKHAKKIHWDWRLLAALVYHESQFNASALSWSGAGGLMQLVPATAAKMGIKTSDIKNPDKNLMAGVKYIKELDQSLSDVKNKDERIKFVLASYNVGITHVMDARALAHKYGKNKNLWEENVAVYLRLKSDPKYYNDSICRSGYCRGEQTCIYVDEVLARYKRYVQLKK